MVKRIGSEQVPLNPHLGQLVKTTKQKSTLLLSKVIPANFHPSQHKFLGTKKSSKSDARVTGIMIRGLFGNPLKKDARKITSFAKGKLSGIHFKPKSNLLKNVEKQKNGTENIWGLRGGAL